MPLPVTRLLRGTRASPPGMAAGDVERRHVYGAALQKAEDLFEAAAAVGPLARPSPLFYAVSQAGRAITAAWLEDGWQTKGHGIGQVGGDAVWEAREHPALPGEAVGEWSVRAIAAATAAGRLTAGVELGALWSATSCQVVYGDPSPSRDRAWSRGLGEGQTLQGCR
jgi:hypothetical protein